jgi:hypothetical protein
MKKKLFIAIIFIWVLISWCSDKGNFQFEFDNFYWYFFTEKTFVSDTKLSWLWYNLLKNEILKIYKSDSSSWYTDSIIITKKQSNNSLDDFVKEVIKQTKIKWYKIESTRQIKINCLWENIDWKTINSKFIWNLNTTYFSHSFLKHNNNIYIISYSTQDNKERKTFSSDVKNIKCKK